MVDGRTTPRGHLVFTGRRWPSAPGGPYGAAMTPHATLAAAAVEQRLGEATDGLCRDHPGRAPAVRGVLGPLRDRLHHVHAGCQAAGAVDWAAYSADLDRGLDELSVEIGRAAQQPDGGPTVDAVLHLSATRFELRAWQLKLAALAAHGADDRQARQRAETLAADLAALQTSPRLGQARLTPS